MDATQKLQFDNALMRVMELEQDVDDLLYTFHCILGILGLSLEDLQKFDDETLKTVIKAVKSKIMMAVGDQEGFVELFKPFANDASRLGIKYQQRIIEIVNEREK